MVNHVDSEDNTDKQNREFSRVRVALDAMIKLDNGPFLPCKTVNISEGGILLKHNQDIRLDTGCRIQVHMPGIITDDDPNQKGNRNIFQMEVIRQTGGNLGLKFI